MKQLMALRDESHRVEGELGKRNTTVVLPTTATNTVTSNNNTSSSSLINNNRYTSIPTTSPIPDRSAPPPPFTPSTSPPDNKNDIKNNTTATGIPPSSSSISNSSILSKKNLSSYNSGASNASITTPNNRSNTSTTGSHMRSNSTARSINGAASVARSTTRSVSPSRTAVTNTSTVTNSVVYRSSMYRSSSPSKAVKNGVVISNFSRSSRFKEEKTDVPGPGKYSVHNTDFAPVTVVKGTDTDGKLGHTWSQYYANTGAKPTPQQAHADAMAAATARINPMNSRSPDGGNTISHIGSPGTVDTSISGMGMSSSASTIGGNGGIESHARQLIAGFHGDIQAALEATLKREKALRKELLTVRENANKARLESSHALSTLTNEVEGLKSTIRKRDDKINSLQIKNQTCNDIIIRSDEALNLLGKAIQETMQIASSVGHRNPALVQVGERMRSLESIIRSGMGAMGIIQNISSSNSVDGSNASVIGGGYTSYSSLTAAVSAPEAANVGTLGGSEKLVNTQNMKNQLVHAVPPPPPPRERPLTGAQARGIAPGVDNAYKNISVSAIASFAKRTAEAINDPSPNALTKAALGTNAVTEMPLSDNSANSFSSSTMSSNISSGWGGESPSHSKVNNNNTVPTKASTISNPPPQINNAPLTIPNRGRDIAALLENFSEDFLQPNVLTFFNTHKAALLSMFSRYAGGTARITRNAALSFAQDYRIIPAALTVEEVTRLVSEVLRT